MKKPAWVFKLGERLRAKKWPITGVIFVALVIGGSALFYYKVMDGNITYKKTDTESKPLSVQGIESVTNGQSAHAVETLKKAEVEAKTPEEKNRATGGLIMAYMNTNDTKSALDAALRLDQADPDGMKDRAYMTAKIYERLGDNASAIKYYQISREYTAVTAGDDGPYTKQERLNELDSIIAYLSKK